MPLLKNLPEIPFSVQGKNTPFQLYTDSLFLPFLLLLFNILRPPGVLDRSRKPWVLFFFLLCGLNVVYVPIAKPKLQVYKHYSIHVKTE